MTIEKNNTMGGRLAEEIAREFGSYTKAAEAMGAKNPTYFRPYLNNTSKIGMILQKKLGELGLDVGYIINGKRKTGTLEPDDASVEIRRKLADIQYRVSQMNQDIKDLCGLLPPLGK